MKWPIFHMVLSNEGMDQRATNAYKNYIRPESNKKKEGKTFYSKAKFILTLRLCQTLSRFLLAHKRPFLSAFGKHLHSIYHQFPSRTKTNLSSNFLKDTKLGCNAVLQLVIGEDLREIFGK